MYRSCIHSSQRISSFTKRHIWACSINNGLPGKNKVPCTSATPRYLSRLRQLFRSVKPLTTPVGMWTLNIQPVRRRPYHYSISMHCPLCFRVPRQDCWRLQLVQSNNTIMRPHMGPIGILAIRWTVAWHFHGRLTLSCRRKYATHTSSSLLG